MIHFYNVSKSYASNIHALKNLNLNIEKGEGIFLTGPSGAGKSTLIKLIFAEEMASSGQVLVNGLNLKRIRKHQIPYLRRQMGVVFQDFKLLMNHSVFDNVALALEIFGMPKKEIAKRVRLILRMMDLESKMNVGVRWLSGGEQQRVAIARAAVNEPKILLADEPTGNLDPERSIKVLEYLKRIHARGTTMIVATHDMSLLTQMAWKQIRIQGGKLTEETS